MPLARVMAGEHALRGRGQLAVGFGGAHGTSEIGPQRRADQMNQGPRFLGGEVVEMRAGTGRSGRGGGPRARISAIAAAATARILVD